MKRLTSIVVAWGLILFSASMSAKAEEGRTGSDAISLLPLFENNFLNNGAALGETIDSDRDDSLIDSGIGQAIRFNYDNGKGPLMDLIPHDWVPNLALLGGYGVTYGGAGGAVDLQLLPYIDFTIGFGKDSGESMTVWGTRLHLYLFSVAALKVSYLVGDVMHVEVEDQFGDHYLEIPDHGYAVGVELQSFIPLPLFAIYSIGAYYTNSGEFDTFSLGIKEYETIERYSFAIGLGIKMNLLEGPGADLDVLP